MHRTRLASRALAPLLASLLLVLSACGGGGGGDGGVGGDSAGGGDSGSVLSASVGDGGGAGAGGTSSGGTGISQASGPGTVASSGGAPITSAAGSPADGSPGDDVLTGNEQDNLIVGDPFVFERIFGLDGNDVLDGGGRHGAHIDGGNGNDRLIVSFGTLVGGPGADTFVAGGRGAHTSPEIPITITDFNAAEGDRIEIYASQAYSSADLFARGILRFEPATSRLIFDLDPSTTAFSSVDQVFILEGTIAASKRRAPLVE